MRPALIASFAVALLVTASVSHAQVTVVDRGAFSIQRNGTAVGTEEFEIRRLPGVDGAQLEARGTSSVDGTTIHPLLTARPSGSPLAYRVEVREGSQVVERASGQSSPGRIRIDVQSPTGRSAREYGAADGTVVLDDGVFHQYYFAAQRAAEASPLTVLVPRRNVQLTVRASSSADRVRIGGVELAATRTVLSETGGAERTVWTDAEGRLLQVSIPAQHLTAVRQEPPR